MNVLSPQLRAAAVLGALLLPASLPPDSRAAVRSPVGAASQPAPSVRPRPGPTTALHTAGSHGRQVLFRLRGGA